MAAEHLNARPVFPSGVRHANVPHTSHFTVVGNHLAQHAELSLTAIGLAVYIQSLPGGSPVGISTLVKRFTEGEIRIGGALRELEHHGYLSRTREQLPGGKIITRTVSYNRPGATPETGSAPSRPPRPAPSPRPQLRPRPRPRVPVEAPPPAPEVWPPLAAEPAPEHVPEHEPEPPAAPAPAPAQEPPSEPEPEPADGPPPVRETPAPADLSPLPAPEEVIPSRRAAAKALLGRLRRIDQRLLLGARDIDRLAGAVEAWLERGASLEAVTVALTAGLPERPRNPAGLVAYRLTHQLPPVAEPIPREFTHARPHPIQTCDTCDKTFRAPRPDDDCPWCVARAAA